MIIHNLELWNKILSQENGLTPIEYWPYKTGAIGGSSIIAEDNYHNNSKLTEVVSLVKKIHLKAREQGNVPIDNKMAVMCMLSLENGEEIEIPVYFVIFNSTYTICTQIRSDWKEPVKI